jgi:hypothetical protein
LGSFYGSFELPSIDLTGGNVAVAEVLGLNIALATAGAVLLAAVTANY